MTNISQKQEIGGTWAGDDMSTTRYAFLRRGEAIYLAVWRGAGRKFCLFSSLIKLGLIFILAHAPSICT